MKKKNNSVVKAATMYAALLAAFLFSSCSKTEVQDVQPANAASAMVMSDAVNPNATSDYHPSPTIPADLLISITHGTCFGDCPYYSVMLKRNGEVTFTGIRNVHTIGTVNYTISADVAYQLGYMMQHNGFFNLEDNYPVIPDAQRFETMLAWNGKMKNIVDYGFHVPPILVQMRRDVEKALNVDRYINGDSNNPAANHNQ